MKTATTALIALLNSSVQFLMADLITITLVGGEVIRYTSADMDVVWGGNTFSKFNLERSKVKVVRGLEVDTLELTFYPNIYPAMVASVSEEDQILGISWLLAVRLGALDGATITLERAFFSDWPTLVGTLILFTGQVADVPELSDKAQVNVKSDLEICNRPVPRNLYQSGCLYTLYDADCGINKASVVVNGNVQAASTILLIDTDLTQADGWFDLGVIEFVTSGNLDGQRRTIKSHVGGLITLAAPLLEAPAVGDSFIAWPGCDKKMITCGSGKFNNLDINGNLRYRGFPTIPKPETAYG